MEYISTGKLPHVFLEDNVKISNNNTTHYLTERLEHNELHKLANKIKYPWTTMYIFQILTNFRYSKVIRKSDSGIVQLSIPLCVTIDLAKTVVLNISANRLLAINIHLCNKQFNFSLNLLICLVIITNLKN